ncbi:MAG: hypothetical protein Kow0089_02100 [Desulfobulbaceae bacterium]
MHYPGETWKGKTWLEQNRIPATRVEITQELLAAVPGEVKLRYLRREALPLNLGPVAVDEPGYLFHPARFSFSFQNYLASFPAKSRKKILREIERLERHGVAVRYGNIADAGWVFRTNLETFGVDSYFYDPRFLDSMERLVSWLHNRKMLEVTTILLGGVVAAVDIGAVWRGIYTVLAGATNPLFPGVAKMINFYHLQRACRERMRAVDFLCGDFGWKERFRLLPRPLYELHVPSVERVPERMAREESCVRAE